MSPLFMYLKLLSSRMISSFSFILLGLSQFSHSNISNKEILSEESCHILYQANKIKEFNHCLQDYLQQLPSLEVNENDQLFQKAEELRLGLKETTDQQLAKLYYLKAASNGYAPAQLELALIYAEENSSPSDLEQSHYWLEQAAQQNDATAQLYLGQLYQYIKFKDQDIQKAIYWLKKSAENGNRIAAEYLGIIYHEGLLVPKYLNQAIIWYKKSADAGNQTARLHLAGLYQFDIGSPTIKQKQTAKDILRQYVRTNSNASYIALNYKNGENGFPKDPSLGSVWDALIAEQQESPKQMPSQ